MKLSLLFLLCLTFSMSVWASNSLSEGDSIPQGLSLPNQNGTLVQLDAYKGQWLILYFYPKDDTPGCRREAITFSGLVGDFKAQNAVIFGVNTDSAESHRKFIEKYDLKIDLLVDENKQWIKLFDVSTTFGFCSRDTVLISPKGTVEKIYRGVSPEGNPKEILSYLKDMEGSK